MQHPVPKRFYDANDPFGATAGRRYPHTGSDYGVGNGSTVESIANAVVYHTGFNAGNGNYVCCYVPGYDWDGVQGGTYIAYLHLSEILVSKGATVSEGQAIGLSGNTGSNSLGPHLHITLSNSDLAYLGMGDKVDPFAWIEARIGTTGGGGGAPAVSVDGDFGPRTKRALQTVLGVTADGDFGPASTRALQTFLGVTADGSWGPATTRALQTFLGVAVDGSFGPQTVRALQASLNAGSFVKPVVPEPPKPEPVKPVEPPKPEPVKPEPVNPEPVKPEPVKPVKPVRPVPPKPTKPEEKPLAEKLEHQKNLAHKLQVNDLGSIISNSRTRKIVWAVWTVFGLLLAGVMGGYAAVQLVAPDWVVFAMGVSLALQPAFGSLAIANITPKKES
jgi:murein DD-endopeptidase MepM/ murein hydrolase activator NlpD